MQLFDDQKYFSGVLTSFQSKAKDEEVYNVFTIKHECEGEIQVFLDKFSELTSSGIKNHFQTPVYFKNITFDLPCKVDVEFDEVTCESTLLSIKANRTFKGGTEKFVYTLTFSSSDFDNTRLLSTYLNQKEVDENGKKRTIQYDVMVKYHQKLTIDI